MYDIIIVGAGPAGLTAALYAKLANKNVLILEANVYGGKILTATKIENYPGIKEISGYQYATDLYNQVISLGCEIKYEEVIKILEDNTVVTPKNAYKTKKVIIATGTGTKKLNIPEESKYLGKGISYCATCDGNFYKDENVAIVGGGNTALEDAIYLSNIAKKVYLIHRRDEFRGLPSYVDQIKKIDNIEILYNSHVTKLIGENALEEIEVSNINKEMKNIKVKALFIAIGQTPNNKQFTDIFEIDKYGYAISTNGVYTNKKGIFVAGDIVSKDLRQLTTAVADGSLAATAAIKELNQEKIKID